MHIVITSEGSRSGNSVNTYLVTGRTSLLFMSSDKLNLKTCNNDNNLGHVFPRKSLGRTLDTDYRKLPGIDQDEVTVFLVRYDQ